MSSASTWSSQCQPNSRAAAAAQAARSSRTDRSSADRSRSNDQRSSSIWTSGDLLEPDRLPDAGRAVVPDRVRLGLPVLLAARLGQVVRIVFGPDDQHVLRRRASQGRGDVGGERRVAALVRGDKQTVDPDLRPVIDRAEVEQHAAAPSASCGRESPPIPDHRVETGLADAAGRRFRRERDDDRPVEDIGAIEPVPVEAAVVIVVRELP